MGSVPSEHTGLTPVKIVVAGGFGVGKTTFVGAISEIEPLRSEAMITDASDGIDDLYRDGTKTETTVAMDFGGSVSNIAWSSICSALRARTASISCGTSWRGPSVQLCLSTPAESTPASQRSTSSRRGTPFVVAVNTFHGRRTHEPELVRKHCASALMSRSSTAMPGSRRRAASPGRRGRAHPGVGDDRGAAS